MLGLDPAEIMADVAASGLGELVNIVTGRLRNGVRDRGIALRCGVPNTGIGPMAGDADRRKPVGVAFVLGPERAPFDVGLADVIRRNVPVSPGCVA